MNRFYLIGLCLGLCALQACSLSKTTSQSNDKVVSKTARQLCKCLKPIIAVQEKYAKTSRNPTEFQEAVNTYSECAERARASLERKMQKQPEQRQLLENKLQEAIKNTCPELYFAIGTF